MSNSDAQTSRVPWLSDTSSTVAQSIRARKLSLCILPHRNARRCERRYETASIWRRLLIVAFLPRFGGPSFSWNLYCGLVRPGASYGGHYRPVNKVGRDRPLAASAPLQTLRPITCCRKQHRNLFEQARVAADGTSHPRAHAWPRQPQNRGCLMAKRAWELTSLRLKSPL